MIFFSRGAVVSFAGLHVNGRADGAMGTVGPVSPCWHVAE